MPRRNKKKNRKRASARMGAPAGRSSNMSQVEAMRSSAVVTSPGRMIGGFPDRIRVKLRYAELVSLASTSGVFNYYEFNGNSAYDPNRTGTGGQPAGYDDFAANYNRYRVLGSQIVVNSHAITQSATSAMIIGLYPYNTTAAATTIADSVAQPYSLAWRTTTTPSTVVHSMTTAKMVGQDPRTADRLQAQYNASPNDTWIWRIFYQSEDGSTTSANVILVVIDYDVEFFDRITGNLDQKLARMLELKEHSEKRLARKEFSASDVKRESPLRVDEEADYEFILNELRSRRENSGGKTAGAVPLKSVRNSNAVIGGGGSTVTIPAPKA
jgi:hypothetical protein